MRLTCAGVLTGVASAPPVHGEDRPDAVVRSRVAEQSADRRNEAFAPLHGVAFQITWAEDVVETYGPLLEEIAALGANGVMISISGYQQHAGTGSIWNDAERTPSAEDVIALARRARAAELRVMLMPKVLLSEPRGTEWRGRIEPPSWEAWFGEYRAWLLGWARAAEAGGAEVFVVGSELVSSEKHTGQWRRIISEVREVFGGRLCYSANWDHYSGIEFWDDLDVVGLTTYHKLASRDDAPVEELVRSWEKWRDKVLKWRERVDRPLVLTEVGWASQRGCSVEPWNYLRSREASAEGLAEQARCYEAFVRAWGGQAQPAGTLWWEWTPGAGGAEDGGYTPKGKPAEAILRGWFRARLASETGVTVDGVATR